MFLQKEEVWKQYIICQRMIIKHDRLYIMQLSNIYVQLRDMNDTNTCTSAYIVRLSKKERERKVEKEND